MSVNVAVVGMGHWGKNLVRNFHELGALKVVCDSDETPRATIEKSYPGVGFTTDFEDVLRDDSIQAVAVASPAVTHHMIAKSALEAGKDVYVEKPLATNLPDGEELVLLADDTYRARIEANFARYRRVGAGWEVDLKNGTTLFFGSDSSSRVIDESGGRIFKWLLEKSTDVNGKLTNIW